MWKRFIKFLNQKPIGKKCTNCQKELKDNEVLKFNVEYAILDKCPNCKSINTIITIYG